jgi:hypothetical protein
MVFDIISKLNYYLMPNLHDNLYIIYNLLLITMTLDHPDLLTEQEWASFIEKLNTPATETQKKMMQNSIINGNKIRSFI